MKRCNHGFTIKKNIITKTFVKQTDNGKFHKNFFQISDIRNTSTDISQCEIYDFVNFLMSIQNYKITLRVVYLANDTKPTVIT